jgi:Ca2+-binding EF-hand superfamily protein
MKKLALLAAVSLFAAGIGGAAMAQDDAFTTADANKDGSLDLTEVQAVNAAVTQDQFNTADANKDGKLDATEFATLAPASSSAAM